MSIKFANNAFGTLNAGISSSDTSITLSSGQGARFPVLASGEYFYITLIDTSNNLEVVKCTARSTDVLTITRAQDNTTARAFVIGDRVELRVTAAALEDSTNPYDKDTSSTGSFALPVGTTAQQPTAADTEGHIRYDSDDNVVYYSDGVNWIKVSAATPILTSVTGNIYNGATSTLTLAGSGFLTSNLVVNFLQASDSIDADVTVTPASDTSATVTVPAAVYNNVTTGNLVSVTVTNSDGVTSAAVNKTAVGLPTGGTITTAGSYRVHTFTSSGNFVVPTGFTATSDVLLVAGGGGGGGGANATWHGAGGGGAGGMLEQTSVSLSAQTYSLTVGSGGSGGSGANDQAPNGSSGGNTTGFGYTAVGGGFGMGAKNNSVASGGSGGSGGGGGWSTYDNSQGEGGSGTSGQGNSGGFGDSSANPYGGGGGGKGGAGENRYTTGSNNNVSGSNAGGGNGGAAANNAYQTGSNITYAGGGGAGGASDDSSWGRGGYGGAATSSSASGGAGIGGGNTHTSATDTSQLNGGNGAANRGSGGGGGFGGTPQGSGGNGGSGVIVIRYQIS